MVVCADFRAAKAAKEAFRLIGTGFAVRIAFAVVDALRREATLTSVLPGFQTRR
jgi:hypothetical protein